MAASNALYSSASSSAPITVSAVRPWRTALQRDECLPASVFGPVLLRAFRRLASICRYEVIGDSPNWVRSVILRRLRLVADVSSTKAREQRRSHQCRPCSTTRLHHRTDAPRDDDHGRAAP